MPRPRLNGHEPTMRLLILLTVLSISGCHLVGGQDSCPPAAAEQACNSKCEDGNCQSGARCRQCGKLACSREWLCHMTFGCMGRNPKYCACHDNHVTKQDARKLAKAELCRCKHQYVHNCDFKLGFEQAFVDVSMGGSGDVPPLPPANYWSNCARTAAGHEKAQLWFNGYAAGGVAAKAIYEPYNEVAASQMYETGWPSNSGVTPVTGPAWGEGY